jgi:LuxR family maltose regulon positive regulatory protein
MARTSAVLHVALAQIDCQAGDLASARRHLDDAPVLGGLAFITAGQYRWFLARAEVAHAEGNLAAALNHTDEAQALYRPGFFADVQPISAIKARIWISQGDLLRAGTWSQERDWSSTDTGDFLLEFDHLTYVRLLLARSGPLSATQSQDTALEEAARLLARLLGPARTSGRWASVAEIHLLRALALDAQGRRADAVASLADAFAALPEPDGYARLFLDEGDAMHRLLRDAHEHGGAGGTPARLLTAPARATPSHDMVEPLSERELQVLRLLDSDLTGPEIARRLFVSHNTIRTHTRHIFTKLQVTNRRAAVHLGHEHQLI